MWKQRRVEDSDDDVNKCSDDAVNVAMSNDTTILLTSKEKLIGTVITMIIPITTLVIILIGNPFYHFQSEEVFLGLSDQLKSLSTKMDTCTSYKGVKEAYFCTELEKQNRQLKSELQKASAEKDTITCDDSDYKENVPPRFVCLSATSTNNLYKCVFGNRSLSSQFTDKINIIIRFKLLYPEIADDGKIFLEFGLTTLTSSRRDIIVRGQRCIEESGLCLYVLDDIWTKLENVAYEQMSEYVQVGITLELHQSNFVLLSNSANIFISKTSNSLSIDKLYPVFGFYNTHLINISQTIFSKNDISFDGTTVDPHLFISKDNITLSTYQLPREQNYSSYFWESVLAYITMAGFIVTVA
ncbi:uncharacterized protein LOC143070990 [Mytilus galloprovincialis]|uniref:uncharacterized protein LOC143070990 n=1 Tax=Mytilus galloprovincialis TaxID=29158 RepID=UPI003F7BE2F7